MKRRDATTCAMVDIRCTELESSIRSLERVSTMAHTQRTLVSFIHNVLGSQSRLLYTGS